MKKSVLALGFAVFAWILVGCGESKDESNKSNDSSINAKSSESSVESMRHSEILDKESKQDSQGSNKNAKDSAQDSLKTEAIVTKNPQDLYKKCIACHGARGDKVAPGSAGSILIADLSKKILIDDMKGYRAKTLSRGGTAAIMYLQANGLSDEDIEILADYISSFKK